LHKETFYTKSGETPTGGSIVRVRKPVHLLGKEEVDKIADPGVRAVVKAKIEELGGKIAKLENNWPLLPNRNGHPVPVKRVRIEMNTAVLPVGEGRRLRWVAPGETHHIEIYEVMENGRRKWEGRVVSMWEAIQRVARGEPVVSRSGPAETRFLFSLAKEDTVRLKGDRNGIWVVKKISQGKQLTLVPQFDARKERDRNTYAPRIGGLQEHSAEKVVVLPIGDVVPCHE
jgi:CRISPR-associated endonuclease Csn1